MQSAKQAVSEFLHHGNKHSVDIEQETAAPVVHERVIQQQHENITHAVDREVHQHHHQIHVQPLQDKVVESEQHHHNVIPVEHRQQHHNRDGEVQRTLLEHQSKFRDEREVLPAQTTNATNVVVGEHVHHHIHDVIQPVVEREVVQPHIVHTTVPIHETIVHEPFIHKGNVLPTMTMDAFTKAGHTLTAHKKPAEHIEYEGEPLKIDGKSQVGFGGGVLAGITGKGASHTTDGSYTHRRRGSNSSSSSSSSDDGTGNKTKMPRSMRKNKTQTATGQPVGTTGTTGTTTAPHKSGLLNKLDPRT